MTVIIENQYFGCIYEYLILCKFKNIEFDQYETFQKMSFRNRCIIAGSEGPVTLSIPLEKGRNQKLVIKEIRIANQYKWQEQHWRTIKSCYSRSPWFEYYEQDLETFYNTPYTFLVDWNQALFNWVNQKIKLDIVAGETREFEKFYSPENYLDMRNKILPKNFSQFTLPEYQQVFQDRNSFIPNLSILDLLFCLGKESRTYLNKLSIHPINY